MDTSVLELSERREQLFHQGQALEWLTYAGNDERKLLTLLALYAAREPLGETGLYREIEKKCGTWGVPGQPSSPFKYCNDSLYTLGAVEHQPIEVRAFGKFPTLATGVEITEATRQFGIGFAGALLSWSADHPALSLKLLGSTRGKFAARAPVVRYWTLRDLAFASQADISLTHAIGKTAPQLDIAESTRQQTIDRLEQLGLVAKGSVHVYNGRQFRIIQPDFIQRPGRQRLSTLSKETQLLFNALKKGYHIKDVWQKDEFLDLVTTIYPTLDNATIRRVRLRLDNAFAPGTTFLDGVIEDVSGPQYSEDQSAVVLAPDTAQAIIELVNIIEAFRSNDQTAIKVGMAAAERIIRSPDIFGALYTKGSKHTDTKIDLEFERRIVGIVTAAGKLTTAGEVRKAYIEKTGRDVPTRAVRETLGTLAAQGKILLTVQPSSRVKQHLRRLYGPTQ